jgi:hypothetical protein
LKWGKAEILKGENMSDIDERLEAAKALNEVVRRSQSLRSNLGLLNRVMTRAKTRGEALKLARFSRPSRRVVPGKRVRRWTQQGAVLRAAQEGEVI